MHPEAFSIWFLHVRWYGIFCALGFIAGVAAMQYKRKFAAMDANQVSDLVLATMISGVIGARIFYVIQFWDKYKNNLVEIVRIDHGGLVFYGGFLCALATIYIYCRKKKLVFLKVIDLAVPSLALGHALGRIGCFLNGCCYGKVCKTPWLGVVYPIDSPPAFKYSDINNFAEVVIKDEKVIKYCSLPLHPVQLYESLGNFILFGLLYYLLGKFKKPGQLAALYLVGYGILRFADEFFRGDHEDFFFKTFTPAQTLCLFLVPIGIFAFFRLQKKKEEIELKKD